MSQQDMGQYHGGEKGALDCQIPLVLYGMKVEALFRP